MIFLRPFFVLLLLIPFFLLLWQKKGQKKNAWAAVCDPELLPYLTVDIDEKRTKFYYFLMSLLWCIASIALAGPAFLKEDVPTSTVQSALIIVADMSPATDEKALEQMTHKLYDLAKISKEHGDCIEIKKDETSVSASRMMAVMWLNIRCGDTICKILSDS